MREDLGEDADPESDEGSDEEASLEWCREEAESELKFLSDQEEDVEALVKAAAADPSEAVRDAVRGILGEPPPADSNSMRER